MMRAHVPEDIGSLSLCCCKDDSSLRPFAAVDAVRARRGLLWVFLPLGVEWPFMTCPLGMKDFNPSGSSSEKSTRVRFLGDKRRAPLPLGRCAELPLVAFVEPLATGRCCRAMEHAHEMKEAESTAARKIQAAVHIGRGPLSSLLPSTRDAPKSRVPPIRTLVAVGVSTALNLHLSMDSRLYAPMNEAPVPTQDLANTRAAADSVRDAHQLLAAYPFASATPTYPGESWHRVSGPRSNVL
jgi:hypothetical protein